MAMNHVTESSYRALESLGDSVCALAELADAIPSEDRYSALIRILAERLDSDMQTIQRRTYELLQFVPAPSEDEEEERAE